VLYNFYFPTILIVLLAVFNDGAMIALSKDKVTASRMPNVWNLRNIFISGIVYGLYLTLSSWVLFYVATHTSFFSDKIGMHDLRYAPRSVLADHCNTVERPKVGLSLAQFAAPGSANTVYPGQFVGQSTSALEQCEAEQQYVRGGMTRTLLYSQVSISGQAVVFVVRSIKWSPIAVAGRLTYIAFILAQIASAVIAAIGFNGYAFPHDNVANCRMCHYSNGGTVFAFSKKVPRYGTESEFTASVIGCTYYVVVAIIWSIIWYLGLDPIKWVLAWILNEDGFRDLKAHHASQDKRAGVSKKDENAVGGVIGGGYQNPLGRASLAGPVAPPGPDQGPTLARASVVGMKRSSLTPAGSQLARASLTRQTGEIQKA